MENSIELDNGQLTWIPKTVLYRGKEYLAPLNILPMLAQDVMLEFLLERKKEREKRCE